MARNESGEAFCGMFVYMGCIVTPEDVKAQIMPSDNLSWKRRRDPDVSHYNLL